MAKRTDSSEVVQDVATGSEGNARAEALPVGRVQQENVEPQEAEALTAGDRLAQKEGVGEHLVKVNPVLRADLDFPVFDDDGGLKSVESFAAGRVHKVSSELYNAKTADGINLFVDAE